MQQWFSDDLVNIMAANLCLSMTGSEMGVCVMVCCSICSGWKTPKCNLTTQHYQDTILQPVVVLSVSSTPSFSKVMLGAMVLDNLWADLSLIKHILNMLGQTCSHAP